MTRLMALAGTITFFDFRTTSFQPASGTPAAAGTVPEAVEVGTEPEEPEPGTFLFLAGPPVLGLVCLLVLDFLLLLLLAVPVVAVLAIAVLDGVEGAEDEEITEVATGIKVLGKPGVLAAAVMPAAAEAASFSAASPLISFLSLA